MYVTVLDLWEVGVLEIMIFHLFHVVDFMARVNSKLFILHWFYQWNRVLEKAGK